MNNVLNPYVALPIAAVAMIAATLIWYALVRPVPEKRGAGVIKARSFHKAETVEKTVPRTSRNIEHLSRKITYAVPDRYVYDIRLEGQDKEARFSVPAVEGEGLAIGQRVQLRYFERGLPLVGKRIYIKEMEALE